MKNILSLIGVTIILLSSCQKSLSEKDTKEYTAKGKEVALSTSEHLEGQLIKSMKEGGTARAIPFCNTMAMPLTEEMSVKYSTVIKRTSYKVRNENNAPTKDETRILGTYRKLIEANKQLKSIVERDKSGSPHFYAPILLQQKCLACHGEIGKNVTVETDSIIKSLYPHDAATGFKEGDLRGIWSIAFEFN